jgi:hypothetical protein
MPAGLTDRVWTPVELLAASNCRRHEEYIKSFLLEYVQCQNDSCKDLFVIRQDTFALPDEYPESKEKESPEGLHLQSTADCLSAVSAITTGD